MKIKDIVNYIFCTIIIYIPSDELGIEFINLYKGDRDNIPENIMEMSVRNIGAARKGIVDIEVHRL